MSDLEFQFADAHEFSAAMATAPQVAEREFVDATNRLTLLGERTSKQKAPVKTGHLRRAITAEPATFGGGTVTGRWGVSVQSKTGFPYHIPVEKGRRAMGKYGPFLPGSSRKGRYFRFEIGGRVIYTRYVRAAKGHWYMRGGLDVVRPRVVPEYKGALSRIIASIRGGG